MAADLSGGWGGTSTASSSRSSSPVKGFRRGSNTTPTSSSSTAASSRTTSRTGSPSVTSFSTASHPLHLPPTPKLNGSGDAFASSTSTSSSISRSASPRLRGTDSTVRIRKMHSPNPSSVSVFVDADVTRPSLRRLTIETTRVASPAHVASSNGTNSSRASLEELARPNLNPAAAPTERDVVVHKLSRTDTLASICLKYGISAQALRTSNRLWPSDSIHLRTTLNIPLDQCHLPSASAGIERIVREEDGNLVVWERDRPNSASASASTSSSVSTSFHASLSTSTSKSSDTRSEIISPKARRINSHTLTDSANSSTADLINIWSTSPLPSPNDDNDNDDARTISPVSYMNGVYGLAGKGKGKAVVQEPSAVSTYLSSTHNPYSEPLTDPARHPLIPITPDDGPFSLSRSRSSTASSSSCSSTSSNPFAVPSPPTGANGTAPDGLSKRTLTIERVPNSALSFFPPAASHYAEPRSDSLDDEEPHHSSSTLPFPNGSPHGGAGRKSSLFGPLVNTLARFASNELGAGGQTQKRPEASPLGKGGSIRLTSSSSVTRSSAGGGWLKRWDPTYFGDEEMGGDEWNAMAGGRAEVATGSRKGSVDAGKGKGKAYRD